MVLVRSCGTTSAAGGLTAADIGLGDAVCGVGIMEEKGRENEVYEVWTEDRHVNEF